MKNTTPFLSDSGLRIFLRVFALLLLTLAVFGPWGYSNDGVPPPEWCESPHFLQESPSDGILRCVRFLPGTEVFYVWGMALAYLPTLVFSTEYTLMEKSREFLYFLIGLVLFALPVFSTLSVLLSQEARGPRIFNAVAWGLALIPALLIFLLMPYVQDWRLWGILIYIALAIASLLLEYFTAREMRERMAV